MVISQAGEKKEAKSLKKEKLYSLCSHINHKSKQWTVSRFFKLFKALHRTR